MSKIPRELDKYPLLYESYSHLGESRVVAIPLAYGDFSFVKLETADAEGTPKKYFAEGERVYFNSTIKNNGTGPDGASVVIYDDETGVELKRYSTKIINPGEQDTTLRKAEIGIMPDHDWRVRFEMTP